MHFWDDAFGLYHIGTQNREKVMLDKPTLGRLVGQIFAANGVSVRNIDAGEEPFLYSSGNKGPGYVMIKGLVSQRKLLKQLVFELAMKVYDRFPDIEYVSGNATGGMIPAWIMAEALSDISGREIPYFYVRNTRKLGGHAELLTGNMQNDFFVKGRRGMVMEELVNFATTTTNSAIVQREAGYDVRHAATILFYDHAEANALLAQHGVELISLLTINDLFETAIQNGFPGHVIASWRSFLDDPIAWQTSRGIALPNNK